MRRSLTFCVTTLCFCMPWGFTDIAKSSASDAFDWPNWRGPQQNRTSTETNLVDRWDPRGGPGSNLLWKNEELAGRSTPIVMDGRLYTLVRELPGTKNEGAKVICVDAATGEKLWQHRFNVYLTDVPDNRVGWSSCVGDPETGHVYALSVSGYFCCLEGATGKVVWDRSLHEELGLLSTYGGRTNFPLVFEDQVIVSAIVIGWGDTPEFGFLAKPAHRFMAFDKDTGDLRWLNGTSIPPTDTTYSTPTIAIIRGQAAMVFSSGDGEVWALQPRTGKRLWHYPFSVRGIDSSPLVVGDTVYASHSEENILGNAMGALVSLDATLEGDLTDRENWMVYQVMAGNSSPLMVNGKLWVVDDRAKLHIYEPKTGKRIARKSLHGIAMLGAPLVADGKVFLSTQEVWYVLQPNASGVKIVHQLRFGEESITASPIVSHGRIYLPTSKALYCIGNQQSIAANSRGNPIEAMGTAKQRLGDSTPMQGQIIPYDSLVTPGEGVEFKYRLFNALGEHLDELSDCKTEWSVEGPGEINNDGVYTAPDHASHEAALVRCKLLDSVEATARVRIVPPLPWQFDFYTEEKVPLTWVGGRVRYVIREVNGERVAVKRSVLPTPRKPKNKLGTRSRMWMGPINMANYTIQADFALTESAGKMPDMGLINSRYTMTVRSSNKQLRVYSWSPSDFRSYAVVEFQPESGKWYTMKLRVEPAGDRAIVRGKLWPRGQAEPSEWTVEMVDESPNLFGSPGLYGNAQESEIYVDNISVTPND